VTRLSRIRYEALEFIPEHLEEGVFYVSRRYRTASHLCCCGCRLEVVTPLNEARWQATERNGEVWLQPSVGNWSFPCQSHYWIEGGHIRWVGKMSAGAIAAVRHRDHRDAKHLVVQAGVLARLRRAVTAFWAKVVSLFQR
jgi:hypothetical protein